MNKKKFAILVGTRPGIIKMSVLYHAAIAAGVEPILIHSGQHYSPLMDEQIYKDVELPDADYRFYRPDDCITHAEQTAFMMVNIEKALMDSKPDILFVCGDSNTNLAGALAARKLGISLAHVEAGLRSYDWRMPEEHNRRMIDHISDLLFSPTNKCKQQLEHENVLGKAYVVGNTVADAAIKFRPHSYSKSGKVLITLHREENVDDLDMLTHLVQEIGEIMEQCRLNAEILLHPRTKKRMDEFELWSKISKRVEVKGTVGYLEMLKSICESEFILTDSGGLQEEACILGTPCYTLRKSTERPETVECGANIILGVDEPASVFSKSYPFKNDKWASPFGEGNTAEKIIGHSIEWLENEK